MLRDRARWETERRFLKEQKSSTSAFSLFFFDTVFVRSNLCFSQQQQGHLLKDQLEVVKVPAADGVGRPRYTIKPIEDELPFDKV